MKLVALPSEKGDCLLLASRDATTQMLVDGGMGRSFRDHVSSAWAELGVTRLDLVYVSHIDEDHVAGILELMRDVIEWRVHDHKVTKGLAPKQPKVPRPPELDAVWHNAFDEQVGTLDGQDNAASIHALLAEGAATLSGGTDRSARLFAAEQQDFATSVAQAITLSRRISARQLNLRLNAEFDGKLMSVRAGMPPEIRLGQLRIKVIGPFQRDLDRLRIQWDEWLTQNEQQLARIRAQARIEEERLATDAVDLIRRLTIAEARALSAELEAERQRLSLAGQLGKRSAVTAPNLASLMLLVREQQQRVLLTADGHHEDILKGLEHHGELDASGRAHVDVIKVQHHGSEHNATEDFFRKITGDQYVFCANGEHKNPDLRILDALFRARRQLPEGHAAAQRSFKLWFNSSSAILMKEVRQLEAQEHAAGRLDFKAKALRSAAAHMQRVEARVKKHAAAFGGLVSYAFLGGPARDWGQPPTWLAAAPEVALFP